jgi:hypothetical protein
MKRAKTPAIVGILLIGTVTAAGAKVFAQGGIPACATLPNPIYLEGTTAVVPVIQHLGAKLRNINVTLLWNANGDGCTSVYHLAWQNSSQVGTVFQYYEEADPNSPNSKIVISTCNGTMGQVPDLAINDTYWTSCALSYNDLGTLGTLPPSFKEFVGPVQGLVPIVAGSYLYYSDIMVEELQDLYMCGAIGKILTFSNTSTIYDYNCIGSGMRELWVRGLGFANGAVLHGLVGAGCNSTLDAESMVSTVASATSPDTTIGYTSTEFYDENRDIIRALKVRGLNQLNAYLPDTDATSTDKINIREGRYTIQGALKLVAQVDPNEPSGVPVNPGAKKVIDWMQANPVSDPALQLPVDINQIYAQRGVVPQCAMRVTKDSDVAVFRRYRDPMPCHCSFQMLATGKTCIPGCTACTDSSTCPTGKICSHGYCE